MVLEVVMLTGVALALAFVLLSRWLVVPGDDLDTEAQERWLVRHAPVGLRRAMRHVDRRFAHRGR